MTGLTTPVHYAIIHVQGASAYAHGLSEVASVFLQETIFWKRREERE